MNTHIVWFLLCFSVCSLATTSGFAVIDELKPKCCREDQEFRRLLDRLNSEGLDYKIDVQLKMSAGSAFRHSTTYYVHRITLSNEIARQVVGYDRRFFGGSFPKYLDAPEYSFYASLLLAYKIQEDARPDGKLGVGFVSSVWFEYLVKHDKSFWANETKGYNKYKNALVRATNLLAPHGYRERLLFESIPESYLNAVFPARIYRFGAGIIEPPVKSQGKPYEDGVREFDAIRSTAKLQMLPLTQDNLGVWLYYAISAPETNRLQVAKDFCTWCRNRDPKTNSFLSAVMMGLLTVDGYAFDDQKGAYNLNEPGNVLLDYIVEFPIAENATRLKIVRDGGNQALVNDLMNKHGTSEGWRVLLNNPVQPTFVEFKQEEMPKK
jgi:hypothetical protein